MPATEGTVQFLSTPAQKFQQQRDHRLRLLLLHPVAGAGDQVGALEPAAGPRPQRLEGARRLIDPPIAGASDEQRPDIDLAAREQPKVPRADPAGSTAIPLQ